MKNIPALACTNPTTGDRGICTGFHSLRQAEQFGKFRKMKGTVSRPVAIMTNENYYHKYPAGHFVHTQQQLRDEVEDFFKLKY